MSGENIKLNGMDELIETINNLGQFKKYAAPFIRNALDAGAAVIQQEAIRNAEPHRSNKDGPHVADNILVKRGRITKDDQWIVRVGVLRKVGWANPLEKGHIVRTSKGYKFVAARPFLGPAFESQRTTAMADIEYELRRSLPDIVKKIARKKARAAKK